jgi:methylmalonyl-CoA mutase, N-terminal domain
VYITEKLLDQSGILKKKWEDEVKEAAAKNADQKPEPLWSTVSDIPIKRLYTTENIKDINFAEDIGYPGQFPFIRGNQVTGYRGK